MAIKSYNKRIIISGDIVEIYEYENNIITGFTNDNNGYGRDKEATEQDKQENRDRVLKRARTDLRRLINSNVNKYGQTSKFVTLTFSEHITTFEIANYEWKKFRQRVEYYLKCPIIYSIVPEFTKIGRIHFHVIFYNLPYINASKLAELWGNGFIKINKIDEVDNVGAYICKYMTKTEDDKLQNKKCYFSSRKLYKPTEKKIRKDISLGQDEYPLEQLTYVNTFANEYNTITYKQYNMRKI